MPIYVVSDLHLLDHPQSFLFNAKKEAAFCRLCEIVIAENGILVFAGDIFDLTGMTPCHVGHREFFNEAVGPAHLDLTAMAAG